MEEDGEEEERRGREVGQDMGGGTRPDEASTYLIVCQNVILERGIGAKGSLSLFS